MKKLVLGTLAGAVVSVASAREWTVDAVGGARRGGKWRE